MGVTPVFEERFESTLSFAFHKSITDFKPIAQYIILALLVLVQPLQLKIA